MANIPRPRRSMIDPRTRQLDREWVRYFDQLTAQALGVVNLTSDVTGILPAANGGTGVATGLTNLANANIAAAAAIAWSKLSKVGASLADLPTRNASDLSTTVVTYTPTWTGSGGTPTALGNGTLTAYYIRVGGLYAVTVDLTIGATTTIGGTGNWRFSLPAALSVDFLGIASAGVGATAYVGAVGRYDANNMQGNTHGASLIGEASPGAWAAADVLRMTLFGHV